MIHSLKFLALKRFLERPKTGRYVKTFKLYCAKVQAFSETLQLLFPCASQLHGLPKSYGWRLSRGLLPYPVISAGFSFPARPLCRRGLPLPLTSLAGAGVWLPPRAGVIRYAVIKDRAYSVRLCVGTAHGVLLGVALVLWAGACPAIGPPVRDPAPGGRGFLDCGLSITPAGQLVNTFFEIF